MPASSRARANFLFCDSGAFPRKKKKTFAPVAGRNQVQFSVNRRNPGGKEGDCRGEGSWRGGGAVCVKHVALPRGRRRAGATPREVDW